MRTSPPAGGDRRDAADVRRGQHFSLRDLLAVAPIALPGALAQIARRHGARGRRSRRLWGWSLGAGLLFGLALSVASTVVLLRALERAAPRQSGDGRIAVGWLIVEDLVTVLALVLLPALAGLLGGEAPTASTRAGQPLDDARPHAGQDRAVRGADAVVGARVFPWILKGVRAHQLARTVHPGRVALALGVAFGSAKLFACRSRSGRSSRAW